MTRKELIKLRDEEIFVNPARMEDAFESILIDTEDEIEEKVGEWEEMLTEIKELTLDDWGYEAKRLREAIVQLGVSLDEFVTQFAAYKDSY